MYNTRRFHWLAALAILPLLLAAAGYYGATQLRAAATAADLIVYEEALTPGVAELVVADRCRLRQHRADP